MTLAEDCAPGQTVTKIHWGKGETNAVFFEALLKHQASRIGCAVQRHKFKAALVCCVKCCTERADKDVANLLEKGSRLWKKDNGSGTRVTVVEKG